MSQNVPPVYRINYVDALYSNKRSFRSLPTSNYTAIGWVVSKVGKDIVLSFDKKGRIPYRGLVIPKSAIVSDKKRSEITNCNSLFSKNDVGKNVGIYWRDVVYFRDGKLPRQSTLAYTEGKLFLADTKRFVVVKNPETILIDRDKISNHPKKRPSFYAIPVNLINTVEKYDKIQ